MPYKNKKTQSEYQKNWMKKRRLSWFLKNGPCVTCGSIDSLEVDHVDPAIKIDHKVWSWSKIRRDEELKKCQVLCKKCHLEKTKVFIKRPLIHGTKSGYSHYDCRCPDCKNAQKLYQKNWFNKNRK
jgi:5-methylcytosine-specific restriction endonuclease McrA